MFLLDSRFSVEVVFDYYDTQTGEYIKSLLTPIKTSGVVYDRAHNIGRTLARDISEISHLYDEYKFEGKGGFEKIEDV